MKLSLENILDCTGENSQNGCQIQHGCQKSCDTSKFSARTLLGTLKLNLGFKKVKMAAKFNMAAKNHVTPQNSLLGPCSGP